VGYATIAWLIGYLQKRSVGVFVAYRVVLGIVLLVLLQTGKIEPMSGVSQEAANVSASTSRT
jgi:undecaprenyl-diphosphatase